MITETRREINDFKTPGSYAVGVSKSNPTPFSYVIRLWRTPEGERPWAGALINVRTGERSFFDRWEVLIRKIMAELFD